MRSIIDAFATFFFLSCIKLLNVSHALLTYTNVHNAPGSRVGNFLFYDATIEYMGPDHRPYAVLAILVLVVGVLFPLVLLLLYPMQCFQKCLNRCGLNSPGLQMFMQCFQGYYRDRTDGGRECRYFAAVYPAFRFAAYVMYIITLTSTFFLVLIVLCSIVTVGIVLYKSQFQKYTKVDVIMNNQSKRCLERLGNNNNTTERQSNTAQLAQNSHFSKKNWLLRVGLEPTTISLLGDAFTN